MTGIRIHVKRGGKLVCIDLKNCTEIEMATFLSKMRKKELRHWVFFLYGLAIGKNFKYKEKRV